MSNTQGMRYLSLDWIQKLSSCVASSESVAKACANHSLAITQVVTGGPEGDVVYHLVVANGVATFDAGAAPDEDARMEQSWETAVAVATGAINTQELFIGGKISVTGDLQKLIACQAVFTALDAVFETVRQETVYE